jgi:hypothetical protein
MSEISLLKSAFKDDQRGLEDLIQESMQHFSPDELLSFSPVAVSAFPSLPRDDQDSSNYELIKLFQAPPLDEEEDHVIEQSTSLPPLSHMASPASMKKASPVMINLKLVEVDQVESDDDLS